jgi:type IV secretory pathway TraG/TraD family ATPase VirD4
LYLVSDYADTKRVARVHQALLALIIKNGLSAAINSQDGHIVPHYRHKLLLLMYGYARFEWGVYGLADGLAFMAGYGIQSYIVVQTPKQLGYHNNIAANSHINVFLSPADMETAEYISTQLGNIEGNDGRIKPEEILRLRPNTCLTLRAGNAPIFGEVVHPLRVDNRKGDQTK